MAPRLRMKLTCRRMPDFGTSPAVLKPCHPPSKVSVEVTTSIVLTAGENSG